jgi:putative transposase
LDYSEAVPIRTIPLVTGEIYHILNRGVNSQLIFNDKEDYKRALEILSFYQFVKPTIRFSFYDKLAPEKKEGLWKDLIEKNQKLVTLIAFCLMPNHFHFLLRQNSENGISKFLANFQNSFTRYFNTRHTRTGHLFQGQFKAVRIETEEQLLHTSRYIHLNPYTSYVVKTMKDLKDYPWSSLREYIKKKVEGVCEVGIVISSFSSSEQYLQFVLDQRDYQRTLEQIKHLILEK